MRLIGISLAVLVGAVGFTTSADAATSSCRSIVAPMERLACYDRAANAAGPADKPATVKPNPGAAYNAAPATLPVKALAPVAPGRRYWIEAEGGIYGFSKNLPVIAATAPPASTGPTPIPTSPGFIGLTTISTVSNPLITGA